MGNVVNVDSTNPVNIVQSSTYRFVSGTEKNTWNNKQNALGYTPLSVDNIIAGDNVTLNKVGNNVTINSTGGGTGGGSAYTPNAINSGVVHSNGDCNILSYSGNTVSFNTTEDLIITDWSGSSETISSAIQNIKIPKQINSK